MNASQWYSRLAAAVGGVTGWVRAVRGAGAAARFITSVSLTGWAANHAYALTIPIDLCKAVDVAVVGTVTSVESRYLDRSQREQPLPPMPVSDVTFDVDVLYLGHLPSPFTRTFPGGRFGEQVEFNTGAPLFDVGDRYLLLYQERATPGDLRLLLYHFVPPGAQLPPAGLVLQAWASACRDHPEGIRVGDHVEFGGRQIHVRHSRRDDTRHDGM